MHDGKLDYQNDRSISDITKFDVIPSWNSFQVKVQIKIPRAVTDENNLLSSFFWLLSPLAHDPEIRLSTP